MIDLDRLWMDLVLSDKQLKKTPDFYQDYEEVILAFLFEENTQENYLD